jgi:gluconolactonase
MQRRQFLQQTAAWGSGAIVAGATARGGAAGIAERYAGLDSARYVGDLKTAAKVEDRKVFTEGPCCDRAGNVFFTNAEAEKILKWDGQQLTVFRERSNAANGLLFDFRGRLVACEGGAGRVTRTDMKSGEITVLVDKFGGRELGAPNDLCFDQAGRIYFTSRMAGAVPAGGNVNSVYRIDLDGKVERILLAPDIDMPNGIVTSPDDRLLYLIEADPRADHKRCIMVYDLDARGTPTNGRKLIDFYPGRSGDGMAIDAEGNLYIAAGLHATRKTSETLDTRPGIHVVSPAGKLLAFVGTPEDTITNCRFGGEDLKTLYITCGSLLMSLRTQIAGKPLYRPQA